MSGLSVKIVRSLRKTSGGSFVEAHPASNIFHTPEMCDVFAHTAGYRPALWAAVDEAGSPLALLPVAEVAVLGGPLRRLTPAPWPMGVSWPRRQPPGRKRWRLC